MDFSGVGAAGLLLIGSVAFLFLIRRVRLLSRLPAGPWGLPFVGSLLSWYSCTNPLQLVAKCAANYGPIFSVRLGHFNVIFVNGYQEIRQALRLEGLSGRASLEMFVHSNGGRQHRGLLFSDPIPGWAEQRRFALKTLKSFGVGHRSLDQVLQLNLQALVQHLKSWNEEPMTLTTSFCISVINSLWFVLTAKRFDLHDPDLERIIQGVKKSVKHSHMTGPGLFLPGVAKLFKRKFWAECLQMRAEMLSLMRRQVQEHVDTYCRDTTRDFIDAYLRERNASAHPTFTQQQEGLENLVVVLKDLFLAGFETTSTTLLWVILYLAEYPDVQTKAQTEIDAHIGRHRPPCRQDRSRLCFVEAVLSEVQRKCSVVPLGVYHKATQDTIFQGQFFAKESVVLFNFHEAHHNVAYWKDPHLFRPERFLDETETQLIKHEAFMPFGSGRRACLGEALARDTLFVFVTGLLQELSFELAPAYAKQGLTEVLSPQFLLHPPDFQVVVKQRQA